MGHGGNQNSRVKRDHLLDLAALRLLSSIYRPCFTSRGLMGFQN